MPMATTEILKLEDKRRQPKKRLFDRLDWALRVAALALLAYVTYLLWVRNGVAATNVPAPMPRGAAGTIAAPLLNLQPAVPWIFAIVAPLTVMISVRGFFRAAQTPEYRAEDLWYRMSVFREVASAISEAGDTKNDAGERVPLLKPKFRYLLTCVDKFVDDAQDVLTSRARVYYAFGSSAFLAAVGTLHVAGILANRSLEHTETLLHSVTAGTATHFVVLRIFSSLAVAAAVYAIVKAMIAFSSSFFHEATRLLDRRHALRFGRLYIYSRGDEFDFQEMEEAFQWHMEPHTVFQGISPTAITDSALTQLTRTVSELADTVAKVRGAAAAGASSRPGSSA
jgi:hypothetical protein